MPNFQDLLQSIFHNQESSKPDFVIRGKSSLTNIFMDKATKLDIIVSTVKKINFSKDGEESPEKTRQNEENSNT